MFMNILALSPAANKDWETDVQNYQWITASCFLKITELSKLLKEIQQLKTDLGSVGIFFQNRFNYEYGENIRFLVLVNKEDYEFTVSLIRDRLSNFFKSISIKTEPTPITSIFLPFPSSVVEFGLYNKTYNSDFETQFELETQASALVLEAFDDVEISHQLLMFTAFCFQICFIKVCQKEVKSEVLIPSLLDTGRKLSDQSLFINDSSFLIEIANEIMSNDQFSGELEILNKWRLLCEKIVQLEIDKPLPNSGEKDQVLINNYRKWYVNISDLLGMNYNLQDQLNYAVAYALKIIVS
jgi:hypothetical protein